MEGHKGIWHFKENGHPISIKPFNLKENGHPISIRESAVAIVE
jgi:hypothetical protein